MNKNGHVERLNEIESDDDYDFKTKRPKQFGSQYER